MTKVYETGGLRRAVLDKVSINFRESEFAAILGPSGSGKTTLLNIIGGLDKYTSGDLIINEKSTKKFRDKDWDAYRNHRIGFVFQSYNLIPHQTVLNNVRLALTLSGISKRESVRRAKKVLKEVGLGEHIHKLPSQLSGGQMQRVAIARALVNDPDILLADEPTGALDSDTSLQIMELLKKIAEKKLVIMVTHNPELADQYATRIITLKDGKITSDSDSYDGKIKTDMGLVEAEKKSKKTKMSLFTAFGLSMRNLLTKKARTILVAVAGSIGIIGIALISAVSTGFQNYIDHIQEDTLSSYPLTLSQESADLTGVLLSMTSRGDAGEDDDKIYENQVLTATLGTIAKNDLPSFMDYLKAHEAEVKDDLRLIEYLYNVDPLIYTIDATGELAKLNPSSLFESLLGTSSIVSAYSSMTSTYQQEERANMENDLEVLAGRLPDEWNEVIVVLNERGKIGELLTYELGLHDTDELAEIITKIMSGERVDIHNEQLVLSYEDLMNITLKLLYATDTYEYNATYGVYEDMSSDTEYMMGLYGKAEQLKIVGVATYRDELMASTSAVYYLPELVTHIIEKSGETEIVKKQLAEPSVDVFTGKKFGENDDKYNLEFSDLVSVDEAALSRAFGVKIDQGAVAAKTSEYMKEISDDITADVSPVKDVLTERLDALKTALVEKITEMMANGELTPADLVDAEKMQKIVDDFTAKQSFADLTEKYLIPEETFEATYAGLLKLSMAVPAQDEVINKSIESLAVAITEVTMKQEILTAVGDLTSYLTSSFANAFQVDQNAIIGAFRLNFTEEELTRLITTMFTEKESSLSANLAALGYQDIDDPYWIYFYFNDFDGKTHFMQFIEHYNEAMREISDETKVIEYSDTTGMLMNSVKVIVDAVSYVLIAFVSISLVVSSIMIGVITYISVYERTKEIGILRAIGASKHNISSIFNAETFIIGLLSGLFGVGFSYLVIPLINLVMRHFTGDIPLSAYLDPRTALLLIALSVVLTLIGGLIPARAASKKDPVEALRSE